MLKENQHTIREIRKTQTMKTVGGENNSLHDTTHTHEQIVNVQPLLWIPPPSSSSSSSSNEEAQEEVVQNNIDNYESERHHSWQLTHKI